MRAFLLPCGGGGRGRARQECGEGAKNRARSGRACRHGWNLPIYNYSFGTKTPTNGDCTGGRSAVPLQCTIEMNWILSRTVNVILFGASRATTPYAVRRCEKPRHRKVGVFGWGYVGARQKKSGRVCALPEKFNRKRRLFIFQLYAIYIMI